METKQQIQAREAITEALNLHGEVDNYDYASNAKGGLGYKFNMTDKKYFYADITKVGVLSNFGSSRITDEYYKGKKKNG